MPRAEIEAERKRMTRRRNDIGRGVEALRDIAGPSLRAEPLAVAEEQS